MASLLGGCFLGVDYLLGSAGEEVVLEPDIGELVLLDRVDQVEEVFFDLDKLATWGEGVLTSAVFADPLGMGTHASIAVKAAVRVAAEVSAVLHWFFVEAWVIRIGSLDLDDSFLILDLVLIFCLGGLDILRSW